MTIQPNGTSKTSRGSVNKLVLICLLTAVLILAAIMLFRKPAANPGETKLEETSQSEGSQAQLTQSEDGQAQLTYSESTQEQYAEAVQDAITIEEGEVQDLVTITEDSDLVTFNADKDKVLMLSFNNHPESYVEGETFTCEYGEIWAFTDKEIVQWYKENKDGVEDWTLRFNQLLGVPADKEYACVSAFWVDLDELKRPAYETDITQQIDPEKLTTEDVDGIQDWFDDNIVWSYFDSAYPWTRLGYTYDWADNDTDYGLSEFIILPDSEIEVEWTKTPAEFLHWLKEQAGEDG
jgi:hypothetical protein